MPLMAKLSGLAAVLILKAHLCGQPWRRLLFQGQWQLCLAAGQTAVSLVSTESSWVEAETSQKRTAYGSVRTQEPL